MPGRGLLLVLLLVSVAVIILGFVRRNRR